MADKDFSEDNIKMDICHFKNEDGKFVKLSIPENKAKGHAKNHANDIILMPEDGCPEVDFEMDTGSEDDMNMEIIMEELFRHDLVITKITNSECSLGEVVIGFGPTGELLCKTDKTSESNDFSIISRTDTVELQSGKNLLQEYFCESGEIIIGGLIEMPFANPQLFNEGEIVSNSVQSFIVKVLNDNPETVTVNVTYLCYDII